MTSPMNLLCIDDDLEDLELISEAVKAIGPDHVCAVATNGHEGLALAKSLQPSLVLLDINMPALDGRTVLKRIRTNPSLDAVKVCILSTSITPDESEIYRSMGADYCLQKPNTFRELTDSLRQLLQTA